MSNHSGSESSDWSPGYHENPRTPTPEDQDQDPQIPRPEDIANLAPLSRQILGLDPVTPESYSLGPLSPTRQGSDRTIRPKEHQQNRQSSNRSGGSSKSQSSASSASAQHVRPTTRQESAANFRADNPNARFAIWIDELEGGGGLLGSPELSRGAQGSVYLVKPIDENLGWQVRKCADDGDSTVMMDNIPKEAYIMKFLQWFRDKPELRCLSEIDTEWFAIYMDYINGGSLLSYLLRLEDAGHEVPALFVWALAQSLIQFLACLTFGWNPGDVTGPPPNFRSVLHDDLHSGNILLDWDDQYPYSLPRFVLADFGFSYFTNENREAISRDFIEVGDVTHCRDMLWDTASTYGPSMQTQNMDDFFKLLREHWPIPEHYGELLNRSTNMTNYWEFPSIRILVNHVLPIVNKMVVQCFEQEGPMSVYPETIDFDPEIMLFLPGDAAPDFAEELEGVWQWVWYDIVQKRIVGEVPPGLVPIVSYKNHTDSEIASSTNS